MVMVFFYEEVLLVTFWPVYQFQEKKVSQII